MNGLIKIGIKPTPLNDRFHSFLANNEFMEVVNYNLTNKKDELPFSSFFKVDPELRYVITNPISSQREYMRSSLFPQLLKNLEANYNNGNKNLSLYEIAKIEIEKARYTHLSGLVIGKKYQNELSKNALVLDYYYLKSIVDGLLSLVSDRIKVVPHDGSYDFLHPTNALIYILNEEPIG
jgi:phenylalanyl-tRNA synthetase beta chain